MKAYILLALLFFSCRHAEQTRDQLYSRHLQRQVNLRILHTPAPDDRTQYNLLLLNDGQDMDKLRVKEILDSLYKTGKLQPLVVIGIESTNQPGEFGVAGKPDYTGRGKKASFYDAFVNDELYPYAKKQSGLRKFHSVAIAGWMAGGLSAMDIAWNHPDKISRAGVFSGDLGWLEQPGDSSHPIETNRILFNKIKASRKKPGLQYWFYAGGEGKTQGLSEVVRDTRDFIALLQKKNVVAPGGIAYRELEQGRQDEASWSAAFPDFLLWAFPR